MMKYQIPKEHYFRMYNKVFDLDLRATTFLVYSYLVCCAGGTCRYTSARNSLCEARVGGVWELFVMVERGYH